MTTTVQPGAQAPAAGPTGRPAALLAEIRRQRGPWNTVRVIRFYRRLGVAVQHPQMRAVARGDLRDLAAWGWLQLHDQPSNRHYTLNTRKDTAQ